MKIPASRLQGHINRKLEPIVLIRGDDPLLCDDAAGSVRRKAADAGFAERRRYVVDPHFNWDSLFSEFQSPSLFTPKSIYEIRFDGGKIGALGAAMLEQLAGRAGDNAMLLVIAVKVDRSAWEATWAKEFERQGLVVTVDCPEGKALHDWVRCRMEGFGLQPNVAAIERLAYEMEGNFLALAQEIDKLRLLLETGPVNEEDLEESITDSSRFNVYSWVDACLEGDLTVSLRVLGRLRDEGTEPILVLWAVAREIRTLLQMAIDKKKGVPIDRILTDRKVWTRRRPRVGAAVGRLSPDTLMMLLRHASLVDRVAKGRAPGDVWLELERLAVLFRP